MHYLLFFLYLILSGLILIRIPFVKGCGLNKKTIIALFIIKISAGVTLSLVAYHFSALNDYQVLNKDGITEYHLLAKNPKDFFLNIFYSPYQNAYGGYFDAVGSYWNDLRTNIIIKTLAVINLVSKGDFYINLLMFNFVGFLGHIALFRLFSSIYPNQKKIIIFCSFLIPTTLYFSSGIHKDLIVFTALAFYCYGLYFSLTQSFNKKRFILTLFSFFLLLLMRNFLAVLLVPSTLGFIIVIKKKLRPAITFAAIYLSGIIFIIISGIFLKDFQPLKIISSRQEEFLKLPKANSQIDVNKLYPTINSFAHNLPQAINHGFLQPYIWKSGSMISFLPALELFLIQALVFIAIFIKRKKVQFWKPFTVFCFSFSISMFIIIGFIIPNTNTIVRYKSLFLPFVLTPVMCLIAVKKEKQSNTLFL